MPRIAPSKLQIFQDRRVVEKKGNSALVPGQWFIECRIMDAASPRPVTARVMATTAVLRGGLARAARAAGLTVVSSEGEPAITLRGVEQRPVVASVDVAAGERFVTITVQGVPDLDTWLAVLSLLREFDGSAEGEPCEACHEAPIPETGQP